MNELIEHTPASLSLAPEQRALLGDLAPDALPNVVAMAEILPPGAVAAVDSAGLRAVVGEVLARHAVLRHAFVFEEGYRGLRQRALAAAPVLEWQHLDWRGRTDAAALAQWRRDFAAAPLATGWGESVRVALLRLDDGSAVLALAASALVADGTSLRSLLAQIETAWHDPSGGATEEPFQYADYIEWRQDLAEDQEGDSASRYWDSQMAVLLAHAAPRLSYRHQHDDHDGKGTAIQLCTTADAALVARLQSLAGAHDCGVEVLLLAAWSLLLARLTGYEPMVLGWLHDCRLDYEPMRNGIGVYEKILPVLADMMPEESFSAWLRRFSATAASHLEAQEGWKTEAMRDRLGIGFIYGEAQGGHWWLCEQSAQGRFELALQVLWQDDAEASLTLHARDGRYPQTALDRLAEQYLTLLAALVASPEAPLQSHVIVGARERAAWLAWQRNAEFGEHAIGWHVARWAARTPDAEALRADDGTWTYGALLARAHRLGNWMRTQGVEPGMLVALNLPRSADLLVAMLATWSAGAAYLPIEPEWPEARRQAVLGDAAPALVLNAGEGATPLDWIDLGGFSDTPAAAPADLDALAYVLYTSGSTGTPKGVMVSHGALLNYVAAVSSALALDTVRRWALTGTVAADLGNTALFGALYNGACLVVASEADMADGDAFSRFMTRHDVEGLKMVPSHLEALLESAAPKLPLKLVLGGEAAARSLVTRISAIAPDCAIYNHYGPTETTVGVMVHAVAPQGEPGDVLPLSRPLANNVIHVLDDDLRAVPAGAKGMLYVGGAQLCQGYLNRARDGAFVTGPRQSPARLYRTGDLAYVLPEGGVRLAGRADHQLKIRGHRIEPGDIEAQLLNQPGVRQAVVLPAPTTQGGLELAAFLVGDATLAIEGASARLRAALGMLLPAHMVPARLTLVPEFPRLANGKIDRIALSSALAEPQGAPAIAPRDALEVALAECMAQVLGREQVGVDDDFFELGGHSLLVIKLVARLRKRLEMELAAAVIFDNPSVSTLAAALRAGGLGRAPAVQATN